MKNRIMPVALLMNDLHIGKENIPQFILNWNEALDICQKKDIQTIAIGGDLFLSRASQTLDILHTIHDCLLRASSSGISVILANGNHDKVNLDSNIGYCHLFSQHKTVTIVNTYTTIEVGEECLLHIISYFPEDGKFLEVLEQVECDGIVENKKNLLYIHQGVNGALSTAAEKEVPANIFKEFDWVFAGHYHNRCVVENSNVEFIGSSRQHNFGEDDMKGYTILYNDGSSEFIQNKANIRYRVIDIEEQEIDINLIDQLAELKDTGRYRTKVRINAINPQNVDKAKLLEAGASKVEIVVAGPDETEIAASSLFEKFDNSKIKETYKKFCNEREIENVELGLKYL